MLLKFTVFSLSGRKSKADRLTVIFIDKRNGGGGGFQSTFITRVVKKKCESTFITGVEKR